ncbi:MAG TPA: HAMP domain-containing sensor histidine kinase, partial [Caulobacteraceae bacterium]
VTAVAVGEQGVQRLLLPGPPMNRTPDFIDLRRANTAARLIEPWRTLAGPGNRTVRVRARPRFRSGDFVEVVAPVRVLKDELANYLLQILLASLLVSAIAGALLYLGLSLLILRPMQRVTESIERFRADPEQLVELIRPSDRDDEIGRVEAELSRMQEEVRQSLRSRARLAALGEAVAKINHDLRNMLTSARLASDSLAASGAVAADPAVAKSLPRLERALDRALGLARNVLDYGKSSEPAPEPQPTALFEAARAAGEDAGLSGQGVRLSLALPGDFAVFADPDQLHRILVNLMRNARQAIEGEPARRGRGKVTVSAEDEPGWSVIRLADDGPGIPAKARERLFLPFGGSGRPGGAGLGLAIARELAQGHGGDLTLVDSTPEGATFEIRLPHGPAGAA